MTIRAQRLATWGLLAVLAVPTAALAQTVRNFGALLDSATTSADGQATLTLDTSAGTYNMVVLVAGLPLADVTGAEIRDAAGTVVVDLVADTGAAFLQGGEVVRLSFEGIAIPPGFVAQLEAGLTVFVRRVGEPNVAVSGQLIEGLDVGIDNGGGGGGQNAAPTANAGADRTVVDSDNDGSESVTLNGNGSQDTDGVIVAYVWTENGQTLAMTSVATVTLGVGTHTITLTVTDDDGAIDNDEVVVTVQTGHGNRAPSAVATAINDPVEEGQTVMLSAAGSSDPDEDPLAFSWEQIDGSAVASLTGATTELLTFAAPSVGPGGATLTFQVTVDDARGGVATAQVSVRIEEATSGGAPQNPPDNGDGMDPTDMLPVCGCSIGFLLLTWTGMLLLPRRRGA